MSCAPVPSPFLTLRRPQYTAAAGGPQEYDCLHLRRGDFEQYCQFIVEEHDITAAEKGNTCWPSLPCLARRLQRHFLAQSPPSSPLYISSNVELAASDMLSVLNSAAPDRPLYTKENFTALFECVPFPWGLGMSGVVPPAA